MTASNSLSESFEFIFVDPPVKTHSQKEDPTNIGDLSVDAYISYLVNLLDSLAKNLKRDKYLVCLMQDFYLKGEYFMLPALVASNVSNLKFKGIKIYSRNLDTNTIPNKKVYAPVQNHFYALIFTL